MPRFDHSEIDRVQQANNIADVIAEYVSLTRRGKEMVGLCPFHDDKRPSMYVSEAKQIFKCFACGAGGSVITFVQMRENLTFPKAVERLADRAGLHLQMQTQPYSRMASEEGKADPIKLARVNDWAARFYQAALLDPEGGKAARQYLEQRKIDPETAKKWRLGLAENKGQALSNAARSRGIPNDLLVEAGLVAKHGQDRFVHRLIFPIIDASGRVTGFGGRTLGDDVAKYINSPATALFDKSNSLYGLDQARIEIGRIKSAVVVEGYTDCIMAHQAGIKNVVATLGTSFASGHARMLRRFSKNVIILYDGDVAGASAANRALEICLKHNIEIRIATVPGGMDPCDFIIECGAAAFAQMLDQAEDVLTFKWGRLSEQFAADQSIPGRRDAVEDYFKTVAAAIAGGQVSPVDRGIVANRISSVLGIDVREIDSELSKRIRSMRQGSEPAIAEEKPTIKVESLGRRAVIEREILEIVLNEPSYYTKAKATILPNDFENNQYKEIANAVFTVYEDRGAISLSGVLGYIESVELANQITTLAHEGHRKGNYNERWQGVSEYMQLAEHTPNGGGGEVPAGPMCRLSDTVSERPKGRIRHYNLGMVDT